MYLMYLSATGRYVTHRYQTISTKTTPIIKRITYLSVYIKPPFLKLFTDAFKLSVDFFQLTDHFRIAAAKLRDGKRGLEAA